MNTAYAANQVATISDEDNIELNPYSFHNIFKQVVAVSRVYKISESEIFRLLPNEKFLWYTHPQFSNSFNDCAEGLVLEGIMNKTVADGILAAMKEAPQVAYSFAQDKKMRTREPVSKPSTEVADVADGAEKNTDIQSACFNMVTVQVAEPEPELEPEIDDGLFAVENIRDPVAGILQSLLIKPMDVYPHMPSAYKNRDNKADICGWFDGSVTRAPKELVTAFMVAVIAKLEDMGGKDAVVSPVTWPDYHLTPSLIH